MSKPNRNSGFAIELDRIDSQIAKLVKARDMWMEAAPRDYDSDGEGQVYFRELDTARGEEVYHCIARIK